MFLFDPRDALRRESQAGGFAPTLPPLTGRTLLPPGGPGLPPLFPPMSGTPPFVPWPEETQPPIFGLPSPWSPFPTPQPVPGLLDLLQHGLPSALSSSDGSLPWGTIPVSATGPTTSAVDTETPDPFSQDDQPPGTAVTTVAGAFSPDNRIRVYVENPAPDASEADDKPDDSDESFLQPAQTPRQSKSAAPAPERLARTIAPRVVQIPRDDGTFETRKEGTRSWRNNNPGNLKYESEKAARRSGAIGVDSGGFAIFPSYEAGKAAAMVNLRNQKYQDRTVDKAIGAWAPEKENDTAAYQRFIHNQSGLSGDTRMDSLTPQQLDRLFKAIERFEGWKKGDVEFGPLLY